jgi:nickel-dependent lactate racemase
MNFGLIRSMKQCVFGCGASAQANTDTTRLDRHKNDVIREHLLDWLKSIGSLPLGWLTKEMKRRIFTKAETDLLLSGSDRKPKEENFASPYGEEITPSILNIARSSDETLKTWGVPSVGVPRSKDIVVACNVSEVHR